MKSHKNRYCKTCFKAGFNICRNDLLKDEIDFLESLNIRDNKIKVTIKGVTKYLNDVLNERYIKLKKDAGELK